MVDQLFQLVLLASVLIALVGLWTLLTTSPTVGLWILTAMFVATEAIRPPVNLQLSVTGFTVYALDVVTFVMLAIGVVRLLQPGNSRTVSRALGALVLLFAIHLLWGASQFGIQTAVTSSRAWLYFLGPLVYAAYARPAWTRAAFRPLIAGALFISVWALVQTAMHGLHGANVAVEVGGRLVFDSRPVTGTAALFILQCVLIAVSARFISSPLWLWAVLTMSIAVALVQFRTVWAIAVVTIAVAYVGWTRRAIFSDERAALLAMSGILVIAPLALAGAASSSALEYSFEKATGKDSTLEWRTQSWGALIREHSSPKDVALGLPAGTSLARRIDGKIVDRSPHNVYIDALLSFGILGAVLVVGLGVGVVRYRKRVAETLELSERMVLLIVIGAAVFGVTTMFGPAQGILLGMFVQAALVTTGYAARESSPGVVSRPERARPGGGVVSVPR